jgi:replication factor C large subunit
MIRFYRVRSSSIVAYLKKICKIEGIMADEEALEIIAEKSDGDVRSAINDLQFYAEGKAHLTADDVLHLSRRDRELDVFETLRAIFSALDSQAIDRVMRSSQIPIASMDRIDLLSTINENLPFHYSDPDEMAKAYEALSKADVFFGRIVKFQKWELLPYISQLLSAGIAMTKREMAYQKYNFPPSKIVMASRMREKNAILNETLSRISSKFHVSKKVANIEIIPFLRILINSPLSQDLVKWLNLSKDEINLLTSEEETLV